MKVLPAMVLSFALAACGRGAPGADTATDAAPPAQSTSAALEPAPPASGLANSPSCAEEIGESAAEALVQQCRMVSAATHPPCNTANACWMIRAHIEGSCEHFGPGDEVADCQPGSPAFPTDDQQAAKQAVLDYYSALNAGEFPIARSMWEDGAEAAGPSLETFTAGFAHTRETSVTVGPPGRAEGAAGSVYITVPVTVRAVTDTGERQAFNGEYSLRRSNVEGGNPYWRLHSAKLMAAR